MTPAERIKTLLDQLYAPEAAAACSAAIAEKIGQACSGPIPAQRALDHRDALLIAYADQVQSPGEAPLRTLGAFARAHLCGVVSGVHLLPFYPWSSDDGFSVEDYLAVRPSYGTWEDIDALGRDFDLMFDAVLNHMSARSAWFTDFLRGEPTRADFFVSVEGTPDLSSVIRPRALPLLTDFAASGGVRRIWTTFSADQVDLNYANPAVLLASIDVLLAYAARGARFIRLDAIAFLWKRIGTTCLHLPQTHAIIRLWRAVLDAAAPGVLLITETNVPHSDNISYFGNGSDEAQLVYNFALPPLALHALQTGDATHLTRWARTLAPPSGRATFLNFLASHDGIGLNPARGLLSDAEIDGLVQRTLERGGFISYKHLPDGSEIPYEMNINYLDALTRPVEPEAEARSVERLGVAHAIQCSLQGVPALYFHSLFGSRGDPAAVAATGIRRRVNRERLGFAALTSELADPGSRRARVFGMLRDQLAQRRAHAAFSPGAPQRVLDLDPRVFALLRGPSAPGGERFCCLHNCSDDLVTVSVPELSNPIRTLAPRAVLWEKTAG